MKPKKSQPVSDVIKVDQPMLDTPLVPRRGRATRTNEDVDFSNCALAKRYSRHWDDYIELSPLPNT